VQFNGEQPPKGEQRKHDRQPRAGHHRPGRRPASTGREKPEQHTPDPDASLYDRLGGTYGIASAVDVLADRLYDNVSANRNPYTAAFHAQLGHAGFKYLVTAWSIQECGGPAVYPGRDMRAAHAHLRVSEVEFDIVKTEIAATLWHVGVPPREHGEFLDIIESYRSMVVGPAEQWALQPQARG